MIRSLVSTMTALSGDRISPADRISASRVTGFRVPPLRRRGRRVIRAAHVALETEEVYAV
jgi:hypothetical protein